MSVLRREVCDGGKIRQRTDQPSAMLRPYDAANCGITENRWDGSGFVQAPEHRLKRLPNILRNDFLAFRSGMNAIRKI